MDDGLPALHRTPIRRDIQALRAIAIIAVVLYHSWPGVAPGGQVGVDVFFVVSGFLITGMLVREAAASGTIDAPRFYLRRATRLLPSAIIVLAFCAVMTAWVRGHGEQRQFFAEIIGSALYSQNWIQLFGDGETTPMQHFWSLAVEEQFYLVWPALIVLAVALARRFAKGWHRVDRHRARRRHRALPRRTACGRPARITPSPTTRRSPGRGSSASVDCSRSHQSGCGCSGPSCAPRSRGPASPLILGSVLIAADQETFPGIVAAVPVLGTAAVIVAGATGVAWGPDRLLALAPVQWLGGISYALYLWHWPVLAFAPYVTRVPSESWFMVILLALAVTLAWATTRWIETPFRVAARLGAPRPPSQQALAARR